VRGEAVGGGAIEARHARQCVRRGDGAWQPRGDGALTGGPGAGSGG
jgi:hypothetical protein